MPDLRREQLVLLRFEKQLAALAATCAAGVCAAQAADGKLESAEAIEAVANIQNAIMHLAEVTGAAHSALNAKAVEMGARLLEVTGGIPKGEPPRVVASLFGIG
ncbi:MAG: hypothetical protein AB7P23_07895 [Amphiplicatus sp.]